MPQSQDQNLVVPRSGLQPDGSGRQPIAHVKEHQPLCGLGIPLPAKVPGRVARHAKRMFDSEAADRFR